MRVFAFAAAAACAAILSLAGAGPARAAAPAPKGPRNVIVFVADGLRPGSINATDAPTMTRLRDAGVWFENSHSLYPTLTMPNASGLATGHQIGDTGTFGNSIHTGYPAFDKASFKGSTPGSPTPFIEDDRVLGDLSTHFAGNALGEESLLALARRRGFNTAAVGKVGPTLDQDVTQGVPKGASGEVPVPRTVILDDRTGHEGGLPLPPAIVTALEAVKLETKAPKRNNGAEPKSRGDNGHQGDAFSPGTSAANVVQQQYFADALTKAILPAFAREKKSFVVVFWSRDPDGTQHFQGDSLDNLRPGINGPTSTLAVRNADTNLKQILDFIEADPALAARTNVVVTSDHGFSTISRTLVDATTRTASPAARRIYQDAAGKPELPAGHLPAGFLALDLGAYLGLPLFDPETQIDVAPGKKGYAPVDPAIERPTAVRLQRPKMGSALLGGTGAIQTPTDAQVVVVANGGTDLVYVPTSDPAFVKRIADFLLRQDYVDGLFVDDRLGEVPGTLPLSSINLHGAARTPVPTIVVAFKTFSLDADDPLLSAVEIADTTLQQGQGMHGSFGRADTRNTMLAAGPDFKRGFVDRAPASNADLPVTLAKILGLRAPSRGKLRGRVLTEALAGASAKAVTTTCGVAASIPGANSLRTWLHFQEAGGLRYLDEARKDTTPTWGVWVDQLPCDKGK